jgi:hypothetical protein
MYAYGGCCSVAIAYGKEMRNMNRRRDISLPETNYRASHFSKAISKQF